MRRCYLGYPAAGEGIHELPCFTQLCDVIHATVNVIVGLCVHTPTYVDLRWNFKYVLSNAERPINNGGLLLSGVPTLRRNTLVPSSDPDGYDVIFRTYLLIITDEILRPQLLLTVRASIIKHFCLSSFLGAFAEIAKRSTTIFVMSVRPPVCVCLHMSGRLLLAGYSWNLILGILMKIRRKIPGLVKMGKIYRALCMNGWVGSVLSAAICFVQQYRERIVVITWQHFQYSVHCWPTFVLQQYKRNALLRFYDSKGYANARRHYVMRALSCQFILTYRNCTVVVTHVHIAEYDRTRPWVAYRDAGRSLSASLRPIWFGRCLRLVHKSVVADTLPPQCRTENSYFRKFMSVKLKSVVLETTVLTRNETK